MTNIAKDSATLSWLGDNGDVLLNDIVIAESVASPYIIENLESNTEYTVKVVNSGGESDEVTFTTKEITYKEVTLTLDLKNKIVNSTVENPHKAGNYIGPALWTPAQSLTELGQAAYNWIATLDNTLFSPQTGANNYMSQIILCWDAIAAFERFDNNYFSDRDASTEEEKVAVLIQEIKRSVVKTFGFGSGAIGNEMTMNVWGTDSAWHGGESHTASTVQELQQVIDPSENSLYINGDGMIYVLMNAQKSDGVTPSKANGDYASLELTFLVEDDSNSAVYDRDKYDSGAVYA